MPFVKNEDIPEIFRTETFRKVEVPSGKEYLRYIEDPCPNAS